MPPIATQTVTSPTNEERNATLKLRGSSPPSEASSGRSRLTAPMQYQGLLDKYESFELTPSLGREFKDLQLTDLLKAPNSDALLADLAVLISRRGVVFLRDQNISSEDMMELSKRLADATQRPRESTLSIHPLESDTAPEIMVGGNPKTTDISASRQRKSGGISRFYDDVSRWASQAFHTDISFENVPADYSMLKINTLPPTGGDTMWINTYDLLDKMSPSFQEYLSTLEAEHSAEFFHDEARRLGIKIRPERERGHPLNKGDHLTAVHPVVRTNPVTGWRSIYLNKGFTKRILGVTKDEHDMIFDYINRAGFQNHDIQCRFRWGKGSVAIWDNRCTWHCATFDYEEERAGERASSIGEVPYFDPKSVNRKHGLAQEGKAW
ncbi:hypothetical protein BD324DRAFT_630031 [Kockovaella imperatae]|uniref:TauD/TfdA-like domain-containing protein n=1 Tax=Kockovaella imperatae TaxID=4999 RepID=A0A1Y1UDF8_9TREE|nr:hypothetical protein BD324DRAFT_630031 [Kockovaella imperatae]ORX36063.1 hypothetical protein BD324DRAFT_630031 [Kockovaella imperatae]